MNELGDDSLRQKNYDGCLNFATDAWTSPNVRPFVAITIYLKKNGTPMSLLLDMVEVAASHSGVNLTQAFAAILDDYEILDKIIISAYSN